MRKGLQRKFKRTATSSDISLTMTEMFEEFMLLKKGEGLAKRTIAEHYTHFGYFKDYIGRELTADEMTTEIFEIAGTNCLKASRNTHELQGQLPT